MAKEISITELQEEKKNLHARCTEIISTARSERRQMNETENEEFTTAQLRMQEINNEIVMREASLKGEGKRYSSPTTESFSLRRAILSAANRNAQHDAEMEVIERASEIHRRSGCDDLAGFAIPLAEKRSMFTAAIESATGVVIDEEKKEMLLPLEANLVLSQAGARMMTGLQGNIYWPKFSDVDVHWEGENTTAKDAGGAFSKGDVYKPVRLSATASFSKQLLVQDNIDVELFIRNRIAQKMAQKIEQTAFSKAKLSEYAPDGLFIGADLTVDGALSWANIVAMETKLASDNALMGNLAYIMRPELRGVAKTKVKDASGAGGFVVEGNGGGLLNGYKALASTNVPTGLGDGADAHGIIFGNWSDYFIGQWGALDIVVDPFTQAKDSIVNVTVTMWANMGVIRPESFAIGALK